jgi:hypothetical protein
VLVHAESDRTMPWRETESLYQTTLRAAKDASPNDESLKGLQVVDLGEAGRQEVWQSSTRSISKTIAKHGGTCYPFVDQGLMVSVSARLRVSPKVIVRPPHIRLTSSRHLKVIRMPASMFLSLLRKEC